MKINGQQLVKVACNDLGIDLASLIAATSIWANPKCIEKLRGSDNNVNALWKFNIRRGRHYERRRTVCKADGCRLDDNSEANKAIKAATGNITEQGSFNVCHIYKDSCYDKDAHLSIANLILVPKEIASLTDNDERVIAALKFRSYELYKYYYRTIPVKPLEYDDLIWRDPEPFTLAISKSISARRDLYCGYEII